MGEPLSQTQSSTMLGAQTTRSPEGRRETAGYVPFSRSSDLQIFQHDQVVVQQERKGE